MIVVGIDPGARHTGLAVVSQLRGGPGVGTGPRLLAHLTVERDPTEPLLDVSPDYLATVVGHVMAAVRTYDADLIAVERLNRPAWRVAGKVKPTDPSAAIATGLVLGAILGRSWAPADLVVVPTAGHGTGPLAFYPAELVSSRGRGAGKDKLRHERSAYDVAITAPAQLALARKRGGSVYA